MVNFPLEAGNLKLLLGSTSHFAKMGRTFSPLKTANRVTSFDGVTRNVFLLKSPYLSRLQWESNK